MSLHIGLISIQGEHLDSVPDLFERCHYGLVGTPKAVCTAKELDHEFIRPTGNRGNVRKAAYVENGWTHIMDPELVMITNDDVWTQLSRQSSVLCWVCEGTSGTYMFSLFKTGQLIRSVTCVDGDVSETGEALTEEAGIEWSEAFEDDILTLAARLGAPYNYLERDGEYYVYELGEPSRRK